MYKYVLFVTCLCLTTTVPGQDISELERRNGFKDIKLGSIADSVKGAKLKKEFKERDQFPAKLYTVSHPDYESVGEVKVKDLELKSYKGLIYEIRIVTHKDTRVMKALQSLYGKAEYDVINEIYFWKGRDLLLRFSSKNKQNLELVYISFPVMAMMKIDKEKKVDDIANDF
ncbi:MAG TPA: hypothetical protein VGK59_08720 [Ohtaekwangia sp.]